MEDKKLLVIIPYYNVEKHLEEAIEGIIQQTYQNWHLVLIDDASTDNSRKVAEKYKDNKKIILEFYSENKYKIKDLIKKQFKGKENFGKLTDNYISFYT